MSGATFKFFSWLSSFGCIAAGIYLLTTQPADKNSLFGPLLHGMGIYFIAKGFYVGPALYAQARIVQATEWMAWNQGMEVAKQETQVKPFLEPEH